MKRLLLTVLVISVILLGACAPKPAPAPPPTQAPAYPIAPHRSYPSVPISWDEAKDHIGAQKTVCGPVVDTKWASGSEDEPTFLHIGKPDGDSSRFTVIIWIQNRSKFSQPPEDFYLGKSICVKGPIEEHEGVPQIEVKDPTQIFEK